MDQILVAIIIISIVFLFALYVLFLTIITTKWRLDSVEKQQDRIEEKLREIQRDIMKIGRS